MAKEKTNLEDMTIEELEKIKRDQALFMQKQLKYLTVEENSLDFFLSKDLINSIAEGTIERPVIGVVPENL